MKMKLPALCKGSEEKLPLIRQPASLGTLSGSGNSRATAHAWETTARASRRSGATPPPLGWGS
ncbi:hypothetical protein ANO11243_085740 [Dothideomycetidae sp. 11243]|nr:hypothetical protein ANO11243_085740 [fungal sp. No.11243]